MAQESVFATCFLKQKTFGLVGQSLSLTSLYYLLRPLPNLRSTLIDPVTRLSHREFKSRLPGLMGSLKPARTRQRRGGGVRPGSKLPRPLTGFPRSPPAPPPPTHHRGRPHSPAPFQQVSQLPDVGGGGGRGANLSLLAAGLPSLSRRGSHSLLGRGRHNE